MSLAVTNTAFSIRAAGSGDFENSCGLLRAAGLPVEDLIAGQFERFLIAERGAEPLGLVGIEVFGQLGLLRSLVVDASARGFGIGQALVAALEARAATKGMHELWLLTIDADQFFTRLGYISVSRDAAPASIANTQEFSSLCPGDAVLMRKDVKSPDGTR